MCNVYMYSTVLVPMNYFKIFERITIIASWLVANCAICSYFIATTFCN